MKTPVPHVERSRRELMHGGGVPDDCCNTTVSEEKSRHGRVHDREKSENISKGVEFVEACRNKP